jgi:hypothetical protein
MEESYDGVNRVDLSVRGHRYYNVVFEVDFGDGGCWIARIHRVSSNNGQAQDAELV